MEAITMTFLVPVPREGVGVNCQAVLLCRYMYISDQFHRTFHVESDSACTCTCSDELPMNVTSTSP